MSNKICLQCRRVDKRKDYQFCSKQCTENAAANAPRLLRVPPDHVMYKDVKQKFFEHWEEATPPPKIAKLYLITWDDEMRSSFDEYRATVAEMRNMSSSKAEVKRFRAERRACKLGESGSESLCSAPEGDCRLCTAIRTGFVFSLRLKQQAVQRGARGGVRFGGGLYMASSSSKAYEYAENDGHNSQYKAVLMARVVLGKSERLRKEDHTKMAPSAGYDSVEGSVGDKPKELIVYDDDAARPAYLILLNTQ